VLDRDAATATATATATSAPVTSVGDRVEQALAGATGPLTVAALRQVCRVRTATLCEVLATLTGQGRVRKTETGYLSISG